MNTLIHEFRFDKRAPSRTRLRNLAREAMTVISAVMVFAIIVGATILLRLLALPSSHAAIAEALHRVGEAMGPPF